MNYRNTWVLGVCMLCFTAMQAQIVFRGTVLDETTKQPIPNAKIGLRSGGLGETSDGAGRFNYRKYHQVLDETSILEISAPNYKSVQLTGKDARALFNKTTTIYLPQGGGVALVPYASIKRLAVYWDVSASLKTRNTGKELEFLASFTKALGAVEVNVTAFNDGVVVNKIFLISDGDTSEINKLIQTLPFNGSTDFDMVRPTETDAVLLFSDGNKAFGKIHVDQRSALYSVSSLPKANHNKLIQLSTYYSGQYIPLSVFSSEVAMEAIRTNTPLDYDLVASAISTTKGKIVSPAGGVQGAIIMIKGSLETYISKPDGSFEVPASRGDVLQVRYLGMYPKEMLIDGEGVLTVNMTPQDELLEEVVISGNKRTEDDEEINTGFGKSSRKKVGFNVNEITSKEISLGAVYLSDVIRGRFAGVQVSGFGNESTFQIRGVSSINNQLPPVWVVDGALYTDVPVFIDPQNVASISILKGSNATVRYGTVATGGAFVIRTKAANIDFYKKSIAENTALIKGNDYVETEVLETIEGSIKKASYITQLERLDTPEKQFSLYKKMAPSYATSVEFFADMALHFQSLDATLAEKVRLDLAEICGSSVNALRILAYLYDMAESYDKVAKVYERILELAPGESQSYRDLAYAYQESGSYDQALELYINMLGEQIKGVDFSLLESALGNELRHLVKRYKSLMNYERLPNEWLNTDYKLDVRMLVEYSDNKVPFEFQFVNPKKKFFNWKHTLYDNKDRLLSEKKEGVQMEEFIIDEAPHGLWQINVQYLDEGEQFVIPPFLKFVLYRDYGTKDERREVRLIKLTQQSDKVILGKILI
ncbi:MAG: tetratricopeptide (TPR) repeat protein [Dokdonia sp.]|jgi:tetratricopeptide (TPR) repeat protein